MAYGGRIHPGGTNAVASYFFAVSREDEWTSILCRRSVVVIHVDWILHCVAHSFRVPVVGYVLDGTITSYAAFLAVKHSIIMHTTNFYTYLIFSLLHLTTLRISCTLPTDDFDAGLPFSRMGIENHILVPVVSPRYPQRVSHPSVPQSLPQTPPCIPTNVPQKRKRRRDSLSHPNTLRSEAGDSLPRRPRKRQMLSPELSSSSSDSLSDIKEAHDSAVTNLNPDARTTHVVTSDVRITNISSDNHAPRSAPPSKAMSKYKSEGSSFHGSSRNDHVYEKAVDSNCAYECVPGSTLTANGTNPVAYTKDSPPVPAIDFTRLQFPSRNHARFPLPHSGPVTATAKIRSRKNGENSARSAVSNHTSKSLAQDVPPVTQQPNNPAVPETCSSGNHDTKIVLPITRQGTRVGSFSSPRRLGDAIDSRHDTATYYMDQLIQTRKRATDRDDVLFATIWESNAMWKGMRFWHENL